MTFPKVVYICNKRLDTKTLKHCENWKTLNPSYKVVLYDNSMCRKFLGGHFGYVHVNVFDFLKDGPIKADFWRVCILYMKGGIYTDVDIEPLEPLDDFLDQNVDLVTCSSYDDMRFNPSFIAANKGNKVLESCISWYLLKYSYSVSYEYWTYSVMRAFNDILFLDEYEKKYGVYKVGNMSVQVIEERRGENYYDAHNVYNDVRIFNNRYKDWDHTKHCFV